MGLPVIPGDLPVIPGDLPVIPRYLPVIPRGLHVIPRGLHVIPTGRGLRVIPTGRGLCVIPRVHMGKSLYIKKCTWGSSCEAVIPGDLRIYLYPGIYTRDTQSTREEVCIYINVPHKSCTKGRMSCHAASKFGCIKGTLQWYKIEGTANQDKSLEV